MVFCNSTNLNCHWGAVFFLRSVHIFVNDFDLSKRDKQVKPSGNSFISGLKWTLLVRQALRVMAAAGMALI